MADDYRNQPSLPRGMRNNNPGNITIGDNWQGMVGNDGTFLIFADMSWGIRALGTSLINMINKGYNTIQTLIPQWSATDQAAYIANVSAYTGLDPAEQLGTDNDTISGLIIAISNQENGQAITTQYLTAADLSAGLNLINSNLISTAAQSVAVQVANDPSMAVFTVAAALAVIWIIGTWRKR
jgi:hypothetical protein